ncbi:MAG TPA: MFS transporter [Pedomonas sp.]|uniref:MFS transporter n=1 Tax=Pedomonas sp. TaxID=2976421 RepID=UPI002F4299FC
MLEERLNTRVRFAFGAGAIPETLKNVAWDMFVLFYFTQVLGLSGTLAGLAIGISLVVDAVIDPWVGTLSDSMRRTRLGRRQRLMAVSILPFGIAFALLFSPPASLSDTGLFVWLVVFAIICRAAISLFTIPYYALQVELSRSPLERPLLASFRQVSTAIGRFGLPFIAFTFFFAATPDFANGQLRRDAYPMFGLTVSLVAMVLMVVCTIGTNRRSLEIDRGSSGQKFEPPSLMTTFRQIIEALSCTPNVRRHVLLGVSMFISLGILSVYTLHLSTYFWKLTPEEIRNVSIALPPGTLLAALGARFFIPYFEKKKIMMTCIGIYAAAVLVPIFGPLTGFFPQPDDAMQTPLLILFKFLGGVGYGAFLVTTATVACDIADELELNVGAPRQALLSSFTFFTMGAASAIVNVAAGAFLDIIGFPAGANIDALPAEVVNKLAVFTGIIILGACVLVICIVSRMDISKSKQRRINEMLSERYAAEKESAAETAPV